MSFRYNEDLYREIETTREQAEDLIKNVFPQRIATFKALMQSPEFMINTSISAVSNANVELQKLNGLKISGVAPVNVKKANDDEGGANVIIPENPRTQLQLNILKPHFVQMHKDFILLKIWLNYLIPKIEDGNNFGVDVLQAVLERVNVMEGISTDFTSTALQFAGERALAIKRARKHPYVPELLKVIEELDEYHQIQLSRWSQDLYRNYMIAYDLIMKNIEKIIRPRSDNAENLY